MEKNKKVDLDNLLKEEIGQFGKYQLRTLAIAGVLVIFSSWNVVEYIFTASRIRTRCLIPECDRDTPDFFPSWILNAIPGTSELSFDNCQRFAYNATNVINSTCLATVFDQDSLLECQQYVYESKYSVVYDFDLGCDEWRRSLIGSVRTTGVLVSLGITGNLSDRWGRLTTLCVVAVFASVMGIVRVWITNYTGYIISIFIEASFGSGSFTCVYVLCMELAGPKYRVMVGTIIFTFLAIGKVILGLIAYAVPNWRILTLSLFVPQLLSVTYYWILSESVRWYLSKSRYEEAEVVLKKVAKLNGKELSESSLMLLRKNAEEEKKRKLLESKVEEELLIVQVYNQKPILLRCIIGPIWWITLTLVYYGLSINSVNMSGNIYFNYISVEAVEIPGYWIAMVLLDRVGRKPVLISAYWICGACQLAYIFIPTDFYGVSMALYLIGKCCMAAVMNALYVYTTELFPTKNRNTLLAFCSMIGRLGSIIAPLTPALGATVWVYLPFALFSTLALLSGLLLFLTPETLHTKLPDTMEEAAQLKKI